MIYQFGDCTFDTARGMLRREGEVINMEPQALLVLHYLLEHRDHVVSRDELLEQCWPDSFVSDAALTTCLRRVRQAIGQTQSSPILIQTLHRRGYQFTADVTELAEDVMVTPQVEPVAPQPPAPVWADPPPDIDSLPAAAAESQDVSPEMATSPPLSSLPKSESAPMTERRHLTVLSCTLENLEPLAQQLDPEDYYELMQAFHTATLAVVTPYDGYVAQHVDDGFRVYFGYPQAHEDDAQRAVHSGLELIAALSQVTASGYAEPQAGLVARIGIDTGMVIVSLDAGTSAPPSLAIGSPLTRAVRLGELAQPGTVVISETTAKLVEGYFDCKRLDDQTPAGQSASGAAYEILGATTLQTRLDVGSKRGLTPFVGREPEQELLRDRWAYAQEEIGQAVILRGEAGIGKSRLVQALKTHVLDEQSQFLECRCSPYHQRTALYPVIDLMQRVLRAQSATSSTDPLEILETLLNPYAWPLNESVPLLASLLSLPVPEERYPPLPLTPARQRERTLDVLSTLLIAQASEAPMLFIVEDLHWADPSTLDFLELLMAQVSTASMLLVLTCRPLFEAPWSERTWMTSVNLNRLTHPQIHQMITQAAGGKAFSPEVAEQLAEKTDGVPLFVEELTRAVLETGQFEETGQHYELVGELAHFAIPETLHDSLMSRLDRLGSAKEIAQWGAVIGREFTYEVLRMLVPHDETVLQDMLDRLVASNLMLKRGLAAQVQYRFKHALVQDVAYQSLRRQMRQDYHRQIAEMLEGHFPEVAITQPELLAHHFSSAALGEQAIAYWRQAGERAIYHSNHREAISHLRAGLDLLATLPDTEARTERELTLQTALGRVLQVTRGVASPEAEQAYARARALSHQVPDSPQLASMLLGLRGFYAVRGDLHTARELGQQLVGLAHRQNDTALLVDAHRESGHTLFYLGETALAHTHLEQSNTLYLQRHQHAPRTRQDARVSCLSYMAWIQWLQGYPAQALTRMQEAIELAQTLSHAFSLVYAQFFAAWLHHLRGESQAASERAEAAITLATDQGFPFWLALSHLVQGWARVVQGESEAGLAQMQQGLSDYQATGAQLGRSAHLALVAEAYGLAGQPEAGLAALQDAMALVERTGERWWEAELHRLSGALLHQHGQSEKDVETHFVQALTLSRQQGTKSWELRAAMSLGRLWQQQNKPEDAYHLLTPILDSFTEGFDTADLQAAQTLCAQLA